MIHIPTSLFLLCKYWPSNLYKKVSAYLLFANFSIHYYGVDGTQVTWQCSCSLTGRQTLKQTTTKTTKSKFSGEQCSEFGGRRGLKLLVKGGWGIGRGPTERQVGAKGGGEKSACSRLGRSISVVPTAIPMAGPVPRPLSGWHPAQVPVAYILHHSGWHMCTLVNQQPALPFCHLHKSELISNTERRRGVGGE